MPTLAPFDIEKKLEGRVKGDIPESSCSNKIQQESIVHFKCSFPNFMI